MMRKEYLFDYFSNFEDYPVRYPKYCGQLDIISRSDNETITRELWNIETPKEYELIEVRYQLTPSAEISYEIISENRIGIKNMMRFSVSNNSSTKSTIEYSLPIIDIMRKFFGPHSTIYEDFIIYLLGQDSLHMQNNQNVRFALGQTCPKCKTGKLWVSPNNEFTAYEDMRVKIERFECDLCHEIYSNSMAISGGRIRYNTQAELFKSKNILKL